MGNWSARSAGGLSFLSLNHTDVLPAMFFFFFFFFFFVVSEVLHAKKISNSNGVAAHTSPGRRIYKGVKKVESFII